MELHTVCNRVLALVGSCLVVAATLAVRPPLRAPLLGGTSAVDTEGTADRTEWIVLEEGKAFQVPANATFVLTGLGNGLATAGTFGVFTYLFLDGLLELTARANMCCGNGTTIKHVPAGLVVHAGTRIEVQGSASGLDGRAWGYLTSAATQRETVVVRQGTPFVVPTGKRFRLTGVGAADDQGLGRLLVDGQVEIIGGTQGSGIGTSVMDVPIGFEVDSGHLVEVVSTAGLGLGRAWGHLIDG